MKEDLLKELLKIIFQKDDKRIKEDIIYSDSFKKEYKYFLEPSYDLVRFKLLPIRVIFLLFIPAIIISLIFRIPLMYYLYLIGFAFIQKYIDLLFDGMYYVMIKRKRKRVMIDEDYVLYPLFIPYLPKKKKKSLLKTIYEYLLLLVFPLLIILLFYFRDFELVKIYTTYYFLTIASIGLIHDVVVFINNLDELLTKKVQELPNEYTVKRLMNDVKNGYFTDIDLTIGHIFNGMEIMNDSKDKKGFITIYAIGKLGLGEYNESHQLFNLVVHDCHESIKILYALCLYYTKKYQDCIDYVNSLQINNNYKPFMIALSLYQLNEYRECLNILYKLKEDETLQEELKDEIEKIIFKCER